MRSLRQALRNLCRALDEGPQTLLRTRSLQLLESKLSPLQRQQWRRHRYFDVIGGKTGRRYRIQEGRLSNVAQLNARGQCVRLLCFEPEGVLPIGDVMLAQKIALELFEFEALAVANKSPGWYGGWGR
jgi:hypothetical protein